MTLSAVASRYASALADVVTAAASPLPAADAVVQLHAFEAALASASDLRNALATPSVPVARKRAVVGRIAEILELSTLVRNFLYVLVDHRRVGLLADIVQSFEVAVDERLGFARAEVATANELSGAQRAALNTALDHVTGKRIRMRFAIDESLIGGVVARIGSTVYDGSVRGRLESLERRLGAES